MNTNTRHLWPKFREVVLPWSTGALLALSSNWAAEAIAESLRAWNSSGDMPDFDPGRACTIGLFVITLVTLCLQRNVIFKPRTRYLRNETPEPRRHLILFLSDLNKKRFTYVNGIPEGLTLSGDLENDIQAMEVYKQSPGGHNWPWEMGLRGIRAHLGKPGWLQTVTVVCSDRTIHDAHHFLAILNLYSVLAGVAIRLLTKDGDLLAGDVTDTSLTLHSGFNFESFDELSDNLWSFLKRHKYPGEEVMIDFTGGQKVTSVVAAALTFNRRIKAQYIQTNKPWNPISYDVIHAVFDIGNVG